MVRVRWCELDVSCGVSGILRVTDVVTTGKGVSIHISHRSAMSTNTSSPRITHISWGCLEIEGREMPFKDAKLFPGGAREWDWRETGTAHDPGIQPSDVEELVTHGARVIILSQGMEQRLKVKPETLALLEEQGIEVHVLPTERAVERYNQLREDQAVGGLFHSTC